MDGGIDLGGEQAVLGGGGPIADRGRRAGELEGGVFAGERGRVLVADEVDASPDGDEALAAQAPSDLVLGHVGVDEVGMRHDAPVHQPRDDGVRKLGLIAPITSTPRL